MEKTEYTTTEAQGHKITVKASISFQKGGINWYNGANEKKGYYLHLIPVERSEVSNGFISECFTLGEGFKFLLLEVTRQSEKRFNTAKQIADQHKDFLIAKCTNDKLNQLLRRRNIAV